MRGTPPPETELASQRTIVEAFIAALRAGDVEQLIAVLDPDVEVIADGRQVRGAKTWAQGAVQFAKAMQHARAALVDGAVALVMVPRGKLQRVLRFWFADGRIVRGEVISDPARLAALEIAPL